MKIPVDWLLEDEPWVVYHTRCDLLGQSEKEPELAFNTIINLDNREL